MKLSRGDRLFEALNVAFFVTLSVTMVYPFVHMLSVSFSTPAEAAQPGLHLFPRRPVLSSYQAVFQSASVWRGLFNSIVRTVAGTVCSLVAMTAAAYALSKRYLPHRGFYTMLIVFTMYFHGGLIPTYLLVRGLGLIDNRLALIVPVLFNTFSMLIMRNFFMAISHEIEESAKMDGANDIVILVRIIVPISTSIIATVTLWTAVFHWNAWFDAMIYIHDPAKMVLQVYLRRLVVENQDLEMKMLIDERTNAMRTPESMKAAILMVTTLPIIAVYPFLQKYFVKGIIMGSLKG